MSILIVEDEAIIAMGIQDDLECLGYQVTGIAFQGYEALALAEEQRPSLALMDINLRGKLDGIETAVRLRELYQLPIIFLTGAIDDETVQRAKQAEPYGYLLKPFSRNDLRITLEHAISRATLEPALRQSEARYRELFETSLDGILFTDMQGNILDSNLAIAQMLGYDREALKSLTILDLTPSEYIATENKIIEQVLKLGYSDEVIKDYYHKDGSRVPVSIRILLTRDTTGQPAGFWSIIRDMTTLLKSQQALQKSEQRLRNLVIHSPMGILFIDPQGRVTEWNESMRRITGIAASEAIGQHLWELLYRLMISDQRSVERYATLKELLQTGLSVGRASWLERATVHEMESTDGQRKIIEWTSYPIQDQAGTSFIGILRDITEEKSAEQKRMRQDGFSQKLAKFTQLLNAELELPKVLEIVCSEISQALAVDSVGISMYDPEHDLLTTVHANGPIAAEQLALPSRHPTEFLLYPFNEKLYIMFEDAQQAQTHPIMHDFIIRHDIRTIVVTNLVRESHLIGRLNLITIGKRRSYDEDELTFLVILANHATVAIDRARMYHQAKRRTQELEVMSHLNGVLRKASTRQEMLPILLQEALQLTQAAAGAIYLLDSAGNPINSSQASLLPGFDSNWLVPSAELWERAFSGEEIIEEEGLAHSPLVYRLLIPFRSTNALPAIMVLGYTTQPAPYKDIQRVLVSLAEMGGNALHRSGLMEMLEQRVSDRTRELSALYDLTVSVNSPLFLSDLLQQGLQKIVKLFNASIGLIYRFDPEAARLQIETQVSLPDCLLPVAQTIPLAGNTLQWLQGSRSPWLVFREEAGMLPIFLPTKAAFETLINVPIRFEGATLGLLAVVWLDEYSPTAESIAFLSTAAERLGSAIQNDLLRQKSEHAAVIEERQRLARDLHDSVTQSLYSLTLLAEAGKDLLDQQNLTRLKKCLNDLSENSILSLKEMRMLLFELRPPHQEEDNLAGALAARLEMVEQRAGVQTTLTVEEGFQLPSGCQEDLYWVAREALNNALKHSASTAVTIRLSSLKGSILMEIEDNGKGFTVQNKSAGGIGFSTMRERVERLGGTLGICTEPGHGTRVTVELNIPES